ncbi:MAG: TrkH family potassium uptake protein [Syntrophobacterales bacterium]|jgi:trk system potassium uptake protein TrkH|nr:TrkH family potassium uptake protein [Syntrophobacterales bacterium]
MAREIFRRLLPYGQMPQTLLIGGFAAVILAGTMLLMLPWSQTRGGVGFVDALFTSTSAVCVTGLIVVDTGTSFTQFGQVVIVTLIQIGGLGIMTFAALAYLMLGRRMSLASQAALQDAFFQRDLGIEFKRKFLQILLITVSLELAGMLLIFVALLWRQTPPPEALFSAFFHSISAFCNAGFSIYKDSLIGLRDSPVIMTTVMSLIVLGGLGHMVVFESWHHGKNWLWRSNPSGPHPISTHSRIVLRTTLALIVIGWLGLVILGLTKGEATWGMKLSSALFQSITARTAGFNTVDIGLMPLSSLLLITLLMFIGGSPGSCAGGVKTTALAISLAEFKAKLKGQEQVVMLDRRVPKPILDRTMVLIRLSILWNLLGVLLLLFTETGRPGVGFHDVLFEQISAFGTVGLSTGLTDKLTVIGRLWITATMFAGRLGPLTLAMGIVPAIHSHVKYPEGRIMIG